MNIKDIHNFYNIKPMGFKLPNEVKQPDAKLIDEYCKLVEEFNNRGAMKPAEMVALMTSDKGLRFKELSEVVRPFFQFRSNLFEQVRNN